MLQPPPPPEVSEEPNPTCPIPSLLKGLWDFPARQAPPETHQSTSWRGLGAFCSDLRRSGGFFAVQWDRSSTEAVPEPRRPGSAGISGR